MSGFVWATKPGAPAARTQTRNQRPHRSLASLGKAKQGTRHCGCGDGCCR